MCWGVGLGCVEESGEGRGLRNCKVRRACGWEATFFVRRSLEDSLVMGVGRVIWDGI